MEESINRNKRALLVLSQLQKAMAGIIVILITDEETETQRKVRSHNGEDKVMTAKSDVLTEQTGSGQPRDTL